MRLYTKPGTFQALPFLTMAFPLVVLLLVTAFLCFARFFASHLFALYLTWSPFHYAAQGYGLALVYAYRSGCQIMPGDKRLLFWTSLLPFFYAFVGDEGSGLHWLLPTTVLHDPPLHGPHNFLIQVLPYVSMAAIALLVVKVARSQSGACRSSAS